MRTAACLLALALAAPAGAEPLATKLFSAVTAPTPGVPDPIGSYARGCAGGNVEMPESGTTWQMMRLSRDRNWGNPVTVQFLEDLSTFAATQPGWKGLYIGDIGQPRGGPMPSGHQSHQIGLDADIWYLPPKSVTLRSPTIASPSLVTAVSGRPSSISRRDSDGPSATSLYVRCNRRRSLLST